MDATAKTTAAMRPAQRSGVRPTALVHRLAQRRGPPLGHRCDHVDVDALTVPRNDLEHRLDQRLGEKYRRQPKREQLGVRGVVVVLLQFDPGIRDMVDLDLHAELAAGVANLLGQLSDIENLGELVENAVLPAEGGFAAVSSTHWSVSTMLRNPRV